MMAFLISITVMLAAAIAAATAITFVILACWTVVGFIGYAIYWTFKGLFS